MRQLTVICFLIASGVAASAAETRHDIRVQLMRATVQIVGPAKQKGQLSRGTVFFVSQPIPESKWNHNILITANHVLEDIAGPTATLNLTLEKPGGGFTKHPYAVTIRDGATNRWTRHPTADVAVMLCELPAKFNQSMALSVGSALLLGDAKLAQLNLRPGEDLCSLGFPLGIESSPSGFPVLRNGRIASYPVYPTSQAPTILLDMPIYGGNSGGPVFFTYTDRREWGVGKGSQDARGIVGLVSKDVSHVQVAQGYFGTTAQRYPLGLGVVVPAQFILETLDTFMTKTHGTSEQEPERDK